MKYLAIPLIAIGLFGCGDDAPDIPRTMGAPHARYTCNPGHPEHNSLGFRGAELSSDPDYRIICIGASTTYTTKALRWQASYPTRLGEELGVECINAGVAGYSTYDMLTRLVFECLDLDPDLVPSMRP